MNEIISYIIEFLLHSEDSTEISKYIGYTTNKEEFSRYKIVILPSGFFDEPFYGSEQSLPSLPLKIWNETPILYGSSDTEIFGETLVLHADIIASTYFLISRYEEMIRRDVRDMHQRFPGKESLPYRAGFIDSPLVEEYGKILRILLRDAGVEINEPQARIQKIYLTHDLDKLQHYRAVRGFLKGLLKGLRRPQEGSSALRSFFGGLIYDPWYTFPWLFQLNKQVQDVWGIANCKTIVFLRAALSLRKEDSPRLMMHTPDFQTFLKLCKQERVILGLHASYDAGIHPEQIKDERRSINRILRKKVFYNRHHYLNSREPEDMQALIDAHITDDFTMGYADVAGFRLGTCRVVQWINPVKKELTSLKLHPLTIMDGSLSDKRYMYLNAHDAYEFSIRLIDTVERWGGELVLLWHNTAVEKSSLTYHRELYKSIIDYLKNK